MSLWRQLTRGLRVLTNRAAADQDVADEVQHFLDQADGRLLARGLSPEAARRAARLELGSPTAVREQVRGYGWENTAGALFSRSSLRRPPPGRHARLHGDHGAHARHRHRRHHRHLQRRPPDPLRIAALPAGRSHRGDPGAVRQRLAQRRHVRAVSRVRRAGAVVRGGRRVQAVAARPSPAPIGRSGSRASASRRAISSVLGVSPIVGRDFRARRRPLPRPERRHSQRRLVAPAVRRRSRRSSGARSGSTTTSTRSSA